MKARRLVAEPTSSATQTINQAARERMGEYKPLSFVTSHSSSSNGGVSSPLKDDYLVSSAPGFLHFPLVAAYKTQFTVAQSPEGQRSGCNRDSILVGTILCYNSIVLAPHLP